MSKADIGGMLERFNATGGRGDVVSLLREDIARLHELPLEIYGPIIHAHFGWVLTGEDTWLEDPRDRAMLAGLKEHQLANAARRGKFLNDQYEKSLKAVQARKERTHGTPTDNPRTTQVKEEAKDKDKEKVKVSLSLEDGTKRGGLVPPVCPSELEETIHATICTNAPMPNEYPAKLRPLVAELGKHNSPIKVMLLFERNIKIGEKEATSLNEAFVKLSDTVSEKNRDVFHRATVKAVIDAMNPNTRINGKPVNNKSGFVLARLKRVLDAVKVLEGMNAGDKASTTQEQPPSQDDDWE